MCVFCAAIPATAALGTNLNTKQNKTRREAVARGEKPASAKPILKVTLVAVVLLGVCSVVYHTLLFPILWI
jgi:protein-S-isoprenylcysteine O-methyltransferase Ste14